METFLLSSVNKLCTYLRLYLQVSSILPKTQNILDKPVCFTHANVLLSFFNETIHLLGNLPFFKIYVDRFVAQDDSLGANVISKCLLWVRGLVTVSEF